MKRTILEGLDSKVVEFDRALRAVFGVTPSSLDTPAGDVAESDLTEEERRHASGLMRVNHSGEVCAQALYSGQALTARGDEVRTMLEDASADEARHLAWTASRVHELGGRLSLLNPVFYAGSFAIGALSGVLGDRWNLGFLVETERQVETHLDGHLQSLPSADRKSRAVVEQMKADEARHAETATEYGGGELPVPIKNLMKLAAKVMTTATYRW